MNTPRKLSFREQPQRGGVRHPPRRSAPNILTRDPAVVLLIHGFNSDESGADESYRRFTAKQRLTGRTLPPMVRVFWPGDVGPTWYWRAIPNARDTALYLATELQLAARRRGGLTIDIIAHSMGCRLTFELLRQLVLRPERMLRVRRVVLMAAAVSRYALRPAGSIHAPLRHAFDALSVHALSLYSSHDAVLNGAFALGQKIADALGLDNSGLFPIALGALRWNSPLAPAARKLLQMSAHRTGHLQYWSDDHQVVAARVRTFLKVGAIGSFVYGRSMGVREKLTRALASGFRRHRRSRRIGG